LTTGGCGGASQVKRPLGRIFDSTTGKGKRKALERGVRPREIKGQLQKEKDSA